MSDKSSDQSTGVNISSSVLFHFTSSIDNLLNILKNDFSPHYCPEYGVAEDLDETNAKPPTWARPMISFCDLPLFLIKRHLKFYGSYGIGLEKNWGIKNGVSPILYFHQQSQILEPFRKLSSMMKETKWETEGKEEVTGNAILALGARMKPYEGPAWRNMKYVACVRFYDEREWRFLPSLSWKAQGFLKENTYLNEERLSQANSKIAENCKLQFTPDDIQYIILRKEDEILPMIHAIETIKGRFSSDSVKILTTTLMTADRIMEDF